VPLEPHPRLPTSPSWLSVVLIAHSHPHTDLTHSHPRSSSSSLPDTSSPHLSSFTIKPVPSQPRLLSSASTFPGHLNWPCVFQHKQTEITLAISIRDMTHQMSMYCRLRVHLSMTYGGDYKKVRNFF
jgi:hypothetical protein